MKPELYDREPIAYHELGHMIAHHFFGHKVDSVEVSDNFGATRLPNQTVSAYGYIVALCAGKAAVDRWYGWKAKNDEAWRASDDHKKAYEAALQVSEGDAAAATHLVKWGERRAELIIERYWEKFPAVVEALVERGKLKVYNMRR
jgi:hypothetical protein